MSAATSIRVIHLYPRELGINGDVGNVLALRRRAQWRGVELTVHDHEVGAALAGPAHLVHIGSGPQDGQQAVWDDLDRIAPVLREWSAAGVPFLGIGAGWQLLGREVIALDGTARAGAGVLPSRARLVRRRQVGELVVTGELGELAGFENHGSEVELLDGAAPLGTVLRREGDGPPSEGVLAGTSIGTNLHGPLLPMNPSVADRLLSVAAGLAGVTLPVGDDPRFRLVDERAEASRVAIRRRLGL